MGGIHVHHVEARLFGTQRRLAIPTSELSYVGLVHSPGLIRVADAVWHTRHIHGHLPGIEIRRVRAAEPQLDPGKRAVTVHRLGHQGMVRDVIPVPQRCVRVGEIVRCRVDGAVLGAHHSPSALGLHAAQRRQHARAQPAKTGAVGHLVEAVLGCYGSNLDRFEQHVITFVARRPVTTGVLVQNLGAHHLAPSLVVLREYLLQINPQRPHAVFVVVVVGTLDQMGISPESKEHCGDPRSDRGDIEN